MAGLISGEDLRVLGDRGFRRLFLARTGSVLGNAIAPVALAFAVLEMPGGTPTRLGLALVARQSAQIVFLLLGGVIADRARRNLVMIGSDLMATAAQGAMAALFILHTRNFLPILALSTVNGAAPALFLPASKGLVPQLVARERLQSANALLRLAMNASNVFGAAIAGTLVLTIGAGWGLAVDSASFLFSAAMLSGVRLPRNTELPNVSMLGDLRHGWREFASRQWVWVIVLQFSLSNACYNGGINVLGPEVSLTRYGGPLAWTVFATTRAVGLVGGSVVAMRIRPRYPMRAATLATFGFVPAFFILAFGLPIWLVAISALLIGVSLDIFGVLWDTALQRHIPQRSLSRVSAYDQLGSVALGPVGLAVAGPVAAAIGVSQALIAGGALTGLVNAAALISPSVRNLPLSREDGGVVEPPAPAAAARAGLVGIEAVAPDGVQVQQEAPNGR